MGRRKQHYPRKSSADSEGEEDPGISQEGGQGHDNDDGASRGGGQRQTEAGSLSAALLDPGQKNDPSRLEAIPKVPTWLQLQSLVLKATSGSHRTGIHTEHGDNMVFGLKARHGKRPQGQQEQDQVEDDVAGDEDAVALPDQTKACNQSAVASAAPAGPAFPGLEHLGQDDHKQQWLIMKELVVASRGSRSSSLQPLPPPLPLGMPPFRMGGLNPSATVFTSGKAYVAGGIPPSSLCPNPRADTALRHKLMVAEYLAYTLGLNLKHQQAAQAAAAAAAAAAVGASAFSGHPAGPPHPMLLAPFVVPGKAAHGGAACPPTLGGFLGGLTAGPASALQAARFDPTSGIMMGGLDSVGLSGSFGSAGSIGSISSISNSSNQSNSSNSNSNSSNSSTGCLSSTSSPGPSSSMSPLRLFTGCILSSSGTETYETSRSSPSTMGSSATASTTSPCLGGQIPVVAASSSPLVATHQHGVPEGLPPPAQGASLPKDLFRCIWCLEEFPSLPLLADHLKETKHFLANQGALGAGSRSGSPETLPSTPPALQQHSSEAPAAGVGPGPRQPQGGAIFRRKRKLTSAASSKSSPATASSGPRSSLSALSLSEPLTSEATPRKLVRGQDVWLGKGQEQTRQILKCMWCGQSFKTLAELTLHMQETRHYTKVISQEQIASWRHQAASERAAAAVASRKDDASPKFPEANNNRLSPEVEAGLGVVQKTPSKNNPAGSGPEGWGSPKRLIKSLSVKRLLELERASSTSSSSSSSTPMAAMDDPSATTTASTKFNCDRCGKRYEAHLVWEHLKECAGSREIPGLNEHPDDCDLGLVDEDQKENAAKAGQSDPPIDLMPLCSNNKDGDEVRVRLSQVLDRSLMPKSPNGSSSACKNAPPPPSASNILRSLEQMVENSFRAGGGEASLHQENLLPRGSACGRHHIDGKVVVVRGRGLQVLTAVPDLTKDTGAVPVAVDAGKLDEADHRPLFFFKSLQRSLCKVKGVEVKVRRMPFRPDQGLTPSPPGPAVGEDNDDVGQGHQEPELLLPDTGSQSTATRTRRGASGRSNRRLKAPKDKKSPDEEDQTEIGNTLSQPRGVAAEAAELKFRKYIALAKELSRRSQT